MRHMRTPVLAVGFLVGGLLLATTAAAQRIVDPHAIPCTADSDMVQVTPLYSDSLSSSFHICIPREVRAHYHRYHTEHVVVVEGEAIMQLGDTSFTIAPGRAISIPRGTPHAVRVTSIAPLRVISVQSPYFDGSDRVLIER